MPRKGAAPVPQQPTLDLVGIGNAIVDVLAHSEDAFLQAQGITKGAMTLIERERADELYAAMGPAVEYSGGSVANTVAAAACLGSRAAFVGKVRDDQLGGIFSHDIRAAGVQFATGHSRDGATTARCFILVTPDAQRTMSTYLGACMDLGPDDVDTAVVASARVIYHEGYLLDAPRAGAAFRTAMDAAKAAGRKVSLTLSDPFCVERHREEFLSLVEHDVDILFANEHEIVSLYQVDDFDQALQLVRGHCEIAALTRSEKGSVVISGDEIHIVDAEPVERVVDTTGAGDLYAAGFLWAYAEGLDLRSCARAGGIAAAEIIQHFGARCQGDLVSVMSGRMERVA
jgi:sugar/nucleoside kinase (ribokinase family)